MSLGDDGVIVYANPAVETLLGYDPSALRGRHVTDLLPDDGSEGRTRAFRSRLSEPVELCTDDGFA